MVQRGGGAGFVFETGQLLAVEHRGERQNLERDAPAERDLLRFVNDAHAAAPHLTQDAEVAEEAGRGSVFLGTAGQASSGTRSSGRRGMRVFATANLRLERLAYLGEAVFEFDDSLQRRQQHFELLELLRASATECFEVDLFAGLQTLDEFGDAVR
jgi:hypothetical protein